MFSCSVAACAGGAHSARTYFPRALAALHLCASTSPPRVRSLLHREGNNVAFEGTGKWGKLHIAQVPSAERENRPQTACAAIIREKATHKEMPVARRRGRLNGINSLVTLARKSHRNCPLSWGFTHSLSAFTRGTLLQTPFQPSFYLLHILGFALSSSASFRTAHSYIYLPFATFSMSI